QLLVLDYDRGLNTYDGNFSPISFASSYFSDFTIVSGIERRFVKGGSMIPSIRNFLWYNFNLNKVKIEVESPLSQTQFGPFTVKSKIDVATSTAMTFASDVRLRGIQANEFGEVMNDTYDGKVFLANYLYYSPSRNRYITVHVSARGEVLLDTTEVPIRPTVDFTQSFINRFIDSDSVFKVAELNGGSIYRSDTNATTFIMYELRNYNEPFPPAPDSVNIYWRLMYVKLNRNNPDPNNPLGALVFYVDPLNGRVVRKFELLMRPITAKEKFGGVDSVAKSYASDARLMYVLGPEKFSGSELPTDTSVDGRCYLWNYGYDSRTKGKFSVFLILGIPSIDTFWLPAQFTLPLDFRRYLDSDTLAKVVEVNGGSQFRISHEVSEIGYIYSQSLPLPTGIYFHGLYQGTEPNTGKVRQLAVLVDPTTGRYIQGITEVEKDKVVGVPTDYALHQNYPNPFNPTTTITYDIPIRTKVKLVVYNILGQEVAVLVDGEQEAGRYSVKFDAMSLPSGVYFYRLEAGKFVEVKKMMLVK
ncbi:MAG: T9SS type A sorting domain-containing protein, partial [Candidatus Kryptonium sp.]